MEAWKLFDNKNIIWSDFWELIQASNLDLCFKKKQKENVSKQFYCNLCTKQTQIHLNIVRT